MPWRGPESRGEFPSLGELVGEWIEEHCVIPDGERQGEPYELTDEMWRFLIWHYRLRPDAVADFDRPSAPFHFRRSLLVRPQKWGKGPLSAAMICAEAAGPVLFDGWDSHGEPVGRSWATPWIQVTAVSEDQTDNVWRALVPMIELGELEGDIPDTGETRINLPGGGRIDPVTSSAKSRLGQRITFAVQDETHSWVKANGGIQLADNQRRNLAGMGGRSIETTNAWDPSENSVAQLTFDNPVADVFIDYPEPAKGNFRTKRTRVKVIRHAYRDSWWVDLDRIDAEAAELIAKGDLGQAERFFGNRIVAGADAWMDPDDWSSYQAADTVPSAAPGDAIAVGFDGSLRDDATGLVGCRMSDGHLFVLEVWEQPDGAEEWTVPRDEVDAVVEQTFQLYDVARFYGDPPYWQAEMARWAERHPKLVVEWWTNRDAQMAAALERLHTAVLSDDGSHDGHEALTRHVVNARRLVKRAATDEDGRRERVLIRKEAQHSPKKIDLAVCAVLAREARDDALASGWEPPKRYRAAGFR